MQENLPLQETSSDMSLEDMRKKRIQDRKKGRKNPSLIPARLARTSAFAPKRKDFITDSNYQRIYEVPGHSVIKVSGRELGTPHRDLLIAIYRMPRKKVPKLKIDGSPSNEIEFRTRERWRDVIAATGRGIHINNLFYIVELFEDMKKVVMTSFAVEGRNTADVVKRLSSNKYAELSGGLGAGGMGNIISDIRWEGLTLDDYVTIEYGSFSVEAMHKAALASLNADVQNELNSDYAKTFWPYIDSMPNEFSWVDEEMLSHLCGRNIWEENKNQRGRFRRACREAFEDMERVGGINPGWWVEKIGKGHRKKHRYHYDIRVKKRKLNVIEPDKNSADDLKAMFTFSDEILNYGRALAPGWCMDKIVSGCVSWVKNQNIKVRDPEALFLKICSQKDPCPGHFVPNDRKAIRAKLLALGFGKKARKEGFDILGL